MITIEEFRDLVAASNPTSPTYRTSAEAELRSRLTATFLGSLVDEIDKPKAKTPFEEAVDRLAERGEIAALKARVVELESIQNAVLDASIALRRELAEQYPIAMHARRMAEQDWSDAEKLALVELRDLIDSHAKQTEAAKLEYLPTKFRGTP